MLSLSLLLTPGAGADRDGADRRSTGAGGAGATADALIGVVHGSSGVQCGQAGHPVAAGVLFGVACRLHAVVGAFGGIDIPAFELRGGRGFLEVGLAGLRGEVMHFVDHDVSAADVYVAAGGHDAAAGERGVADRIEINAAFIAAFTAFAQADDLAGAVADGGGLLGLVLATFADTVAGGVEA